MRRVPFEQLSEAMDYPKSAKGQLTLLHSSLIEYVIDHFEDSRKFKMQVIQVFNTVTYAICNGEQISRGWRPVDMMQGLPKYEESKLSDYLGSNYVEYRSVIWDNLSPSADLQSNDVSDVISEEKMPEIETFSPNDCAENEAVKPQSIIFSKNDSYTELSSIDSSQFTDTASSNQTSYEDLSLSGRSIPQIDFSRIYAQGTVNGEDYCIYYSLPDVPEKQCDISLTTDISLMKDSDFLKLYPNIEFCTRRLSLYRPIEGLEMHPKLGVIIPVKGFTKSQIIDNMIKYPTLDNIIRVGKKQGMDVFIDFEKMIEIDGQLHPTAKIWKDIPGCENLPMTQAIVHEYVIRRYLLERDIKHVDHKYNMYGDLDPFLTLFMPAVEYINMGYTDTLSIAKSCVRSRISYIRSRNPVLKKLRDAGILD